MNMAKKKLFMPQTMAGIVGISADEELEGLKIEPMHFLVFVLFILLISKVLNYVWNNYVWRSMK